MLKKLEHEKEHKRKIKADSIARKKAKKQIELKNITKSGNTSSNSSKTLEMIEESKDDEIESGTSSSVTETQSSYL
jgi:hypothetical protein